MRRSIGIVRLVRVLMVAAPIVAVLGCAPVEEDAPTPTVDISILTVESPTPALPGTRLIVTARGVVTGRGDVGERQLVVRGADGREATLDALGDAPQGALAFAMSADAIDSLGVGQQALELVLVEGEGQSAPFATTLTLARELSIALDVAPDGTVFRNEQVVLSGGGFLDPGEGSVAAVFVGEFAPSDGSAARAVLAELPVVLAEANDRSRGLLTLTTALGGIAPGTFRGTMSLRSSVGGAQPTRSAEHDLVLVFEPPALFTYAPGDPFIGQIVTVQGGGFLGAIPDDPATADEATLLRFEGELVRSDGSVEAFPAREAVVSFVSGREIRLGLDVEPLEGALVSSFFGVERGVFRGTVTPVVIKGTADLEGQPVPVEVELRGVQQVVHVRFLPAFYDSLRHFGLSAAADEVVAAALERMRGIFADYNVRIETAAPADVLPSALAVMEIGGPDPNGLGLFGYDNTPGKDIGNLRLFDSIGGANAETQADNYPGYGGVFIESFLFWSSHPELGLEGGAGPAADPLFDEIFDPVRAQPATLDEVRAGAAGGERVAQVQRAIGALGAIVGETSAHELGHSLGLAQPFGSATAFHTAVPGEGCLMDNGSERPLGERIGEPGFAPTRFCEDELAYLEQILPLP